MSRSRMGGDREVRRMFTALSKGPKARTVDAAARKSMRPMVEDTRKRLRQHRNFVGKHPSMFPQPVSGRAYADRSIMMRKQTESEGLRTYRMGAVRRARYLLHLLEYGTQPHFQPNFLGGYLHPGTSPRPTITPAYEHGADDVIWDMQDEILDWTEMTVRSMGGRFRRR